jgi:hypothetical protein
MILHTLFRAVEAPGVRRHVAAPGTEDSDVSKRAD